MRGLSWALALGLPLALVFASGCDDDDDDDVIIIGGGGSTTTLSLEITSPSTALSVEPGVIVRIEYRNESPDRAMADFYADLDGDLATVGDQIVIQLGSSLASGEEGAVSWDTTDASAGCYRIVVVLTYTGTGESADFTGGATVTVQPSIVELVHQRVVLRDRWGDAITADSAEPYSTRETCGRCHNIDHISNGYHFQQGRTDTNGRIVMKEDYFADGRQWLKSAGMYGKW